jgi:hypothetical protein
MRLFSECITFKTTYSTAASAKLFKFPYPDIPVPDRIPVILE